MPYETDTKLRNYLVGNQPAQERMCAALLANDRRFTDVRPQHPRGGRDGGKDIVATFNESQLACGAVGFVGQANDEAKQKTNIKKKFKKDLESALKAYPPLTVFIFFTNICLTITEKENLISESKQKGITHCEVWDREVYALS